MFCLTFCSLNMLDEEICNETSDDLDGEFLNIKPGLDWSSLTLPYTIQESGEEQQVSSNPCVVITTISESDYKLYELLNSWNFAHLKENLDGKNIDIRFYHYSHK